MFATEKNDLLTGKCGTNLKTNIKNNVIFLKLNNLFLRNDSHVHMNYLAHLAIRTFL